MNIPSFPHITAQSRLLPSPYVCGKFSAPPHSSCYHDTWSIPYTMLDIHILNEVKFTRHRTSKSKVDNIVSASRFSILWKPHLFLDPKHFPKGNQTPISDKQVLWFPSCPALGDGLCSAHVEFPLPAISHQCNHATCGPSVWFCRSVHTSVSYPSRWASRPHFPSPFINTDNRDVPAHWWLQRALLWASSYTNLHECCVRVNFRGG